MHEFGLWYFDGPGWIIVTLLGLIVGTYFASRRRRELLVAWIISVVVLGAFAAYAKNVLGT